MCLMGRNETHLAESHCCIITSGAPPPPQVRTDRQTLAVVPSASAQVTEGPRSLLQNKDELLPSYNLSSVLSAFISSLLTQLWGDLKRRRRQRLSLHQSSLRG